jgi:hypothetical protein
MFRTGFVPRAERQASLAAQELTAGDQTRQQVAMNREIERIYAVFSFIFA